MKNEKKRYFLVEYYGITRQTIAYSLQEKENILNEVRKYNNRKSSSFLLGNIKVDCVDGIYYISGHLYRKYTNRSTISEIDELTSKYSESELIELFKEKSKMINGAIPDINIAYMETSNDGENERYERGIRYIPVLYKDDLKYMDLKYIRRCLYYHAQIKDIVFFQELASAFEAYHFIADEKSDLYLAIDKCLNQDLDFSILYQAANNLFEKFICEYEKDESLTRLKNGEYQISRRRLRDFGFFIKNYNIRKSKINSPLVYNKPLPKSEYIEEENGQLKLRLN